MEKVAVVFADFEQADEANARDDAQLTPEERIAIMIALRNQLIPMHLNKDLREFVELLNSNRVDFLIVGAFAVGFHGYPRYTGDLDLLFRPELGNVKRTLDALREFGFGSLNIQPEDLLTPGRVVQLGVQPNRIDLLNTVSGVTFEEAWVSREGAELDGIRVQFIGLQELVRNKESTGRAKDIGDAEELKKRQRKAGEV